MACSRAAVEAYLESMAGTPFCSPERVAITTERIRLGNYDHLLRQFSDREVVEVAEIIMAMEELECPTS